MNKMTVTALLWGTQREYMVPIHNDYEQNIQSEKDHFIIDRRRPSLTTRNISNTMKDLILGACLCNNAVKQSSLINNNNINGIQNLAVEFENSNENLSSQTNQIIGDAIDVVLYNLCNDKCSVNFDQINKVNPRINIVPFNSKNKFYDYC